jgi:uncharacterized protein with PQ loop repeat
MKGTFIAIGLFLILGIGIAIWAIYSLSINLRGGNFLFQ